MQALRGSDKGFKAVARGLQALAPNRWMSFDIKIKSKAPGHDPPRLTDSTMTDGGG